MNVQNFRHIGEAVYWDSKKKYKIFGVVWLRHSERALWKCVKKNYHFHRFYIIMCFNFFCSSEPSSSPKIPTVLSWTFSRKQLKFSRPLYSKNIFKIYRNVGRIIPDIWGFSSHRNILENNLTWLKINKCKHSKFSKNFSRQNVSSRVSPRVSDRIICMTPGETLSETRFFTRESTPNSLYIFRVPPHHFFT